MWAFILLDVGWLALLILDMGAMRRPEDGDRNKRTNSHVFFISTNLKRLLMLNWGGRRRLKMLEYEQGEG